MWRKKREGGEDGVMGSELEGADDSDDDDYEGMSEGEPIEYYLPRLVTVRCWVRRTFLFPVFYFMWLAVFCYGN